MIFWVIIERDGYGEEILDLAFGPYPSEESAYKAMTNSLLIDDACQTNCLECYVESTHVEDCPEDAEIVLIDLKDPDHTGLYLENV